MWKRKLRWALAGLAVIAGVVATLLRGPEPAPRLTLANFNRIKCGMSRAEVESILGPPGNYRADKSNHPSPVRIFTFGSQPQWQSPYPVSVWAGEEGALTVYFDGSEKATDGLLVTDSVPPEGVLDKLLWRAKRQWRKWFPER
jgi:hypothetical protein